jgi:hypothetical protein
MKSILVVCLLALAGCATTTLSPNGVSESLSLQERDPSRGIQPSSVRMASETKPRKGMWIGVGLGIASAIAIGQDSTDNREPNLECLTVDIC